MTKILREYIDDCLPVNALKEQLVLNILDKPYSEFVGFNTNGNAIYAEPHAGQKVFSIMDDYKGELFDSNTKSYKDIITEICSRDDVLEKINEVNAMPNDSSIANGIALCYSKDIISTFDDTEYKGRLYNSIIIKCTNTDIYVGKNKFNIPMGTYNTVKLLSMLANRYKEQKKLDKLDGNTLRKLAIAIFNEFVTDSNYAFYKNQINNFYKPYIIITGFTAGFKRLNYWEKYKDLGIRKFNNYPYKDKGELSLIVVDKGSETVDNDTFEKLVDFQNSMN